MKFFESDVVQDELKRMQDLYVDINRMGIILTIDQKIQQLVKLLELSTFSIDMIIIHRIGKIDIGENIVLIVAAGEHRKETFVACEWAIAELKRVAPIWKRETTSGGEVWVSQTP